jgi:ribose transport system substrate-binding protein
MKDAFRFVLVVAVPLLLAACQKQASNPAARPIPTSTSSRKFYWIQPLTGHPTHLMTQLGFKAGCKKLGYDCEVVGTDGWDIGGTIALAEQVLSRGDAAGIALWTGNPACNNFIETAAKAGIPVILPHFPVPEGSIPGATGIISCDPAESASEAAREVGKTIQGRGTVAITQGSFNTTENMAAEAFGKTIHEVYPQVQVLPAVEEGFDPPGAISKAVSIMQGHADLTAAFSTTGNGPITWAGAQKETGRHIVSVGMNYTRANLDLVKNGEVYAVIGQPLWEESVGAAELLDKARRGEKVPWWTKLPAPFVTKDKVGPYYALLDQIEHDLRP